MIWWRAGTRGEGEDRQKSLLISALADETGKYTDEVLYDDQSSIFMHQSASVPILLVCRIEGPVCRIVYIVLLVQLYHIHLPAWREKSKAVSGACG